MDREMEPTNDELRIILSQVLNEAREYEMERVLLLMLLNAAMDFMDGIHIAEDELKRSARSCKHCGHEFQPNPYTPWQVFCSECGVDYAKLPGRKRKHAEAMKRHRQQPHNKRTIIA